MDIASLIGVEKELPEVGSAVLGTVAGIPITNSTIMLLFVTLLFGVLGYMVTKRFAKRPGMFQSFVEATYEWLRSLTVSIVGDEKRAEPVIPVVLTLVFYIGVANVISIIPTTASRFSVPR